MDDSATPAKAIKLGNELVRILGLEPGGSMLSRWVAHYLAEQLIAAEAASGPAKAVAEERCFRTVLELWAHRRDLPSGRRPLEEFEPILETLSRLNPEKSGFFYFQLPRTPKEGGRREKKKVLQLMKFAESVDVMARVLIEFALKSAADVTGSDATRRILQEALPSVPNIDVRIVSHLINPEGEREAETPAAKAALIKKRLKQIDRFVDVCREVQRLYMEESRSSKKRGKAPAS